MGIKEDSKELQDMVLQGKLMDAFEKFYADDVTMQENSEEPRVGKEVNREFEKQYLDMVQEFHGAKLNQVAFSDNGETVFAYWEFDMTFKDGKRKKTAQVSVQKWKDGKIVKERFFYNPN